MNAATAITILRILLIPVFVYFAVAYSGSLAAGREEAELRFFALAAFGIASASDALDGWVARRFNQSTRLGRSLDPVADKLLVLSAILTLSFVQWNTGLPAWFGFLVVTRDVLIIVGVLYIRAKIGRVEMKPLVSSKICTFLQFSCVCWVLLDFWTVEGRHLVLEILIWSAAAFTLLSAWRYLVEGIRQLRSRSYHTLTPDVP